MSRRILVMVLVVALFGVAIGSAAPARAQGMRISFDPVAGRKIPLGAPFRFKLTIDNQTASAVEVDAAFFLVPVDDPGSEVYVGNWVPFIPSGGSATHRAGYMTGQWFAQKGQFQLEVRSETIEVEPLRFRVRRSAVPVPRFRDVTAKSGLATELQDTVCGQWTAGAAWADVDGDRDLDLYLPRGSDPAHLWINEDGDFTDEAGARGPVNVPNALGAVFADYDNDGDQDLYVTAEGPNVLFENDGLGSFTDVTSVAGVGGDAPSQSASWGDYDADGDLDLYVTNHARCGASGAAHTYYADVLYRNEGDGSFTDQTTLLHAEGSTLGAGFQAAWFDYDRDGDVDLYLANDFIGSSPEPNFLWRNDGEGLDGAWRFTDVSVVSGTAVKINSMGIGIGDYDRDLDLDFIVSNIYAPLLFKNENDGTFTEYSRRARLARDNQSGRSVSITWGAIFADLNNDRWEDLYIAAGQIRRDDFGSMSEFQPNALFTNARDGRFYDHSAPSATDDLGVGRGIAVGDYDRDGRIDLFLVNQRGTPRLYRNVTPRGQRKWIAIDLVGIVSNRDACGATLILVTTKGKQMRQVFCGSTSLGSGSDSVVHFGLGRNTDVKKLVIEWPSGTRQVVKNARTGRVRVVRETS